MTKTVALDIVAFSRKLAPGFQGTPFGLFHMSIWLAFSLSIPLMVSLLVWWQGDNCRAELIALWGALQCSLWLGIDNFLIFGDSFVLINSIQGRCSLEVLVLCNWIQLIKNIIPYFSAVSFQHVFQEQNREAYALSKLCLSLCPGFMFFEKFSGKLMHYQNFVSPSGFMFFEKFSDGKGCGGMGLFEI